MQENHCILVNSTNLFYYVEKKSDNFFCNSFKTDTYTLLE